MNLPNYELFKDLDIKLIEMNPTNQSYFLINIFLNIVVFEFDIYFRLICLLEKAVLSQMVCFSWPFSQIQCGFEVRCKTLGFKGVYQDRNH